MSGYAEINIIGIKDEKTQSGNNTALRFCIFKPLRYGKRCQIIAT